MLHMLTRFGVKIILLFLLQFVQLCWRLRSLVLCFIYIQGQTLTVQVTLGGNQICLCHVLD